MALFKFGEQLIGDDQVGFEDILERFYESSVRPLCLCREPGLPMYIAKMGGKYFLKRMPNSGDEHAAECDSYESPADLSGMGELMGSAIQPQDDGVMNLKLDFSLVRTGGHTSRQPDRGETDRIRSTPRKLTLRGLLHLLWHQAGFDKWHPAMYGKRNWSTIFRHLTDNARSCETKGLPLLDFLYVPEPFHLDRKDDINARRLARLHGISADPNGAHKMMLLVGEFKEWTQARFGRKMVAKQVPDYAFLIDQNVFDKLMKRTRATFELLNSLEGSHLLVAATFGVSTTQVATIEEMAVMLVDEHWLPIEDTLDKALIDRLVKDRRSFIKLLRFNRSNDEPMGCVELIDAEEKCVIYIARQKDSAYLEEIRRLTELDNAASLVWDPSEGRFPELPPVKKRVAPAANPGDRVMTSESSQLAVSRQRPSLEQPSQPYVRPKKIEFLQ